MKNLLLTLFLISLIFSQKPDNIYHLTDSLIQEKEYFKALQYLEKDTTGNLDFKLKRARIYSWTKEYEKSLKLFRNIFNHNEASDEDYISFLNVFLWKGEKNKILFLVDSIFEQKSIRSSSLLNYVASFIIKQKPKNSSKFYKKYFKNLDKNDQIDALNFILNSKKFDLFIHLINRNDFPDLYMRYLILSGNTDKVDLENENLSEKTKKMFYEKKGDIESIKKIIRSYDLPVKNRVNYYYSEESDETVTINRSDIHMNSNFYFIYNLFFKTEIFYTDLNENGQTISFTQFNQEFYRKIFNHEFRFSILSRMNLQGWLYGYRFKYRYHFFKTLSLQIGQSKEIVNDTRRTIAKGIYKNNYVLTVNSQNEKNTYNAEASYSFYNDLNEELRINFRFDRKLSGSTRFFSNYKYKDFVKTVNRNEKVNYWLAENLHNLNLGLSFEKSFFKSVSNEFHISGNYISINQQDSELTYKVDFFTRYYFSDFNFLLFKFHYIPSDIWSSILFQIRINFVF